jgi:hypothetical protein
VDVVAVGMEVVVSVLRFLTTAGVVADAADELEDDDPEEELELEEGDAEGALRFFSLTGCAGSSLPEEDEDEDEEEEELEPELELGGAGAFALIGFFAECVVGKGLGAFGFFTCGTTGLGVPMTGLGVSSPESEEDSESELELDDEDSEDEEEDEEDEDDDDEDDSELSDADDREHNHFNRDLQTHNPKSSPRSHSHRC